MEDTKQKEAAFHKILQNQVDCILLYTQCYKHRNILIMKVSDNFYILSQEHLNKLQMWPKYY